MKAQSIPRETVEQLAAILGPNSAAQLCLDAASDYGDRAVFFKNGTTLCVGKRED